MDGKLSLERNKGVSTISHSSYLTSSPKKSLTTSKLRWNSFG